MEIGGWIYNVEEDEIFWTKELFDMHGFEETEGGFIAESLKQYPPAARRQVKKAFKQAINEGKSYNLEVPFENSRGEKMWVRTIGQPITDDRGEVIKVVGNFIDITDKKNTEQDLKERVKELNCLYNITRMAADTCKTLEEIFAGVLSEIKESLRYPDEAAVCLKYEGESYSTANFNNQNNCFSTPIKKENKTVGKIEVCYRENTAKKELSFLQEEVKLVEAVAEQLNTLINFKRIQTDFRLTRHSIEQTAIAVIRLTSTGQIDYCNEKAADLFGSTPEQLKEKKIFDVTENFSRDNFQQRWQALKENKTLEYEAAYEFGSNSEIDVEIIGDYQTFAGEEYAFILIKDITERKVKERRLEYLANHDKLTGLYNRNYIENRMNSFEPNSTLASIIMVDINGLKRVNDACGHDVGDQILQQTADEISRIVDDEGLAARWAGDDFMVMLPEAGKKKAQKTYHKLKEIDIDCKTSGCELENGCSTISLGIATQKDREENLHETFKRAEKNLYSNKLIYSQSFRSNLLKSLLNTLVAKSHETKEHTLRMADLADQLAQKIDLNYEQRKNLSLVAMLHDIGKTSISEDILKKPDKLNEQEWEEIKKHPAYGYNIASATGEISHVAEDILSHHEKWDGSGYPRGLEGEEIPLLARIISIVDAYDVMTHSRPYKEPYSVEYALKELKDEAGSQFDPGLVEEFVEMIEENRS